MKRRDLERHLLSNGCIFHHHGARHDIWTNPHNRRSASVPRHNEIKTWLVKGICHELGVRPPPGKCGIPRRPSSAV
jgi:hypothetical protein